MNVYEIFFAIVLLMMLSNCKNRQESNNSETKPDSLAIVDKSPIKQLEPVDEIIFSFAEKPKVYSIPSNKKSKIKGSKGIEINVDPNRLETIDGSPLGEQIDVELLEMTQNSDLIENNAQTISNKKILETAGAYFINMTSDGKQLKIKGKQGIEIDIPKIKDPEMQLFTGSRDSLNQMNWTIMNGNLNVQKKPDKNTKTKYNSTDSIEYYQFAYFLSTPSTQNYELKWLDDYKMVDIDYMLHKYFTPSTSLIDYLKENAYTSFVFDIDTAKREILNVLPRHNKPSQKDTEAIIETINALSNFEYFPKVYEDISFSKEHFELQIHYEKIIKNPKVQAELKERKKQLAYPYQTYAAIKILNFGWINIELN